MAGVPVPETAVHKHNRTLTLEHQIRPSRQLTHTQPVPQPERKQSLPDPYFRRSIAAADRLHIFTPDRRGVDVGHGFILEKILMSDFCRLVFTLVTYEFGIRSDNFYVASQSN